VRVDVGDGTPVDIVQEKNTKVCGSYPEEETLLTANE
jgi:hypothetical protein